MMKFTKDELYEIEKHFDIVAGIVGDKIRETAKKLIEFQIVFKDKILKKPIRESLMKELQELHRARDVAKNIRDKCERLRLEGG